MKKTLSLIIILILAYSAYWFGVKIYVPKALGAHQAQMQAQGVAIGYQPFKLRGFPLHFKANVEQFRASQNIAPFASIELERAAVSTAAYWPLSRRIKPVGTAQIFWNARGAARGLTADAQDITLVQKGSAGAQSADIDIEAMTLAPISGTQIPLKSVAQAKIRYQERGAEQSVKIDAQALTLYGQGLGQVGRAFGDQIDSLSADVSFSIESHDSVAGPQNIVNQFSCFDCALKWGVLEFNGNLDITRNNRGLQGDMTLELSNPHRFLDRLNDVGILSSQQYFGASLMMGADDGETKTLKLQIRDNDVHLGPMKIARLPF